MSGAHQIVYMNQRSFAPPIVSIDTFFNDMSNYLDDYMSEYRNPSFYSYNLDGDATYIGDGGGDMYDAGNYTYPWLLSNTIHASNSGPSTTPLNYSVVTPTTVDTSFVYRSLGYTGQLPLTILGYRTAPNTPIGLQKSGNSGADGGGTLSSQLIYNGTTINTFTVYAFYRETYNAGDPSHCDLYMLIGHPNWASTFGSINTYADPIGQGGNGGYFYASNSSNVIAVTTLLSKAGGAEVTAAECQTIVQAFTSRMYTYLLAPATVSISDNVANIATGDVTFTFTFSKPVTGFDASKITVTNGTKGAFTNNSNTIYSLVVTPTANSSGDITISTITTGVTDSFGTVATAPANYTQAYDTTPQAAAGQEAFTTAGTYSWVVPAGVDSISAVCIGGGTSGSGSTSIGAKGQSGPGAGLRYINALPVTPAETLTIVVGAGGAATSGNGISGGTSRILRGASVLVAVDTTPFFNGGTGTALGPGPFGGTVGGGNGGTGGGVGSQGSAGGGGAGGYSGNGGNGGGGDGGGTLGSVLGGAGAGGAGAGGNGNTQMASGSGGSGGGVGILGQGSNGSVSGVVAGSGGAGSGGSGILYGGGGFGSQSGNSGVGGSGAVRIIWGPERAFPSTNTGNV